MNVRVAVVMELTYLPPTGPAAEEFYEEEFFEQLMEYLEDNGAEDPGIGLDTLKREVTVGLTSEGETEAEAVFSGMSTIRTAIHTVGGATPGWPTFAEALEFGSVSAVPVTDEAAEQEEDFASA